MKHNSLEYRKPHANDMAGAMRRQDRIHQDELMAPDLVSEIVLAGGVAILVITVILCAMANLVAK